MHEMDGSTLYLMDGLTLLRDTKTASYFRIFHIVYKMKVERISQKGSKAKSKYIQLEQSHSKKVDITILSQLCQYKI